VSTREWALTPQGKELIDMLVKGGIEDRELALRTAENLVKIEELYGPLSDES
jgi:hypothetical protein